MIYSIIEAFSMESACIYIGAILNNKKVSRIMLQTTPINGVETEMYKGYDDVGNLLFEYLKGSVNVTYKYD